MKIENERYTTPLFEVFYAEDAVILCNSGDFSTGDDYEENDDYEEDM